MPHFDVFGMGNSLIDIQAFVDESFLASIGVDKGIMHLIDEERSRSILNRLKNIPTEMLPGGSCANTMSTIAFSGGRPLYTGIVADDEYGGTYEEKLTQQGVKTLTKWMKSGLTGSSIILTTPDAERTMNTHLGVCREFKKHDIDLDLLKESQVFYLTGYMWDTQEQKDTAIYAMEQAKRFGLKVSFDIADPFLVERNRGEFPAIIKEYVDILFGNAQEMMMLTDIESPLEAGKELQKSCEIAAVKIGKEGSYVITDMVEKVDAFPVSAVDSTGAGDSYAGGFLYAYCQGKPLAQCARFANYIASQIVTVKGLGFHLLNQEVIQKNLDIC
ncbi:adenosine kinase [candidate division KSB3 bacterium]|uniref:Adenosine kinase n=1 Tax=candidate division KSB3 bacterium TaxID=2044937 RepID=A0A2G6E4N9_9BACT|nr:MAG: adenosine kinase [candidate division KSB3 bacterium]PIE29664.1 MAG: adenosine kinase [candidate division KSB3 bacterium]